MVRREWASGNICSSFFLISCSIKSIYDHFDDTVGSSGYIMLQCRAFNEELIEKSVKGSSSVLI
jgi:hypothetical protein